MLCISQRVFPPQHFTSRMKKIAGGVQENCNGAYVSTVKGVSTCVAVNAPGGPGAVVS